MAKADAESFERLGGDEATRTIEMAALAMEIVEEKQRKENEDKQKASEQEGKAQIQHARALHKKKLEEVTFSNKKLSAEGRHEKYLKAKTQNLCRICWDYPNGKKQQWCHTGCCGKRDTAFSNFKRQGKNREHAGLEKTEKLF